LGVKIAELLWKVGSAFLSIVVLIQAAGIPFPGFSPAQSVEFMAPGTLGNPNWTAAFLLPLVPILLGVRSRIQEQGGNTLLRMSCTGMAVLIGAATLSTQSKAGVLSLSAGLLVYILLDARLTRRIRSALIIGISALPARLLSSRRWYLTVLASFMVLLGLFQAVRFGAANVLWTRGDSAMYANDYPRAACFMKTAVAFTPENANLLSESAKAFLFERHPVQALQAADRALLTGFSFEDLFLRQRVIKQVRGKAAAFDEWHRMACDFPVLFTPHIELALLYLDRNDSASSRIELETVLRIHQKNESNRSYKQEAKRMLEQIMKTEGRW
jgi:hypothetical protein